MAETRVSMRERLDLDSRNRLKLGLFGANCSSGRAVTKVAERWSGSWADCLRLAQMADEAGIEFMLPIGRWKGYGGDTDYQGDDTRDGDLGRRAAGRDPARLTVFGTVHAPLIHPIIAAKQFVTADHIGEGRFGLNIVCGWNEDEFDMFGATMREHADALRLRAGMARRDQARLGRGRRVRCRRALSSAEAGARQAETVRRQPADHHERRRLADRPGLRDPQLRRAVLERRRLASSTTSLRMCATSSAGTRATGREIDVYTVGVVTCRPTRERPRTITATASSTTPTGRRSTTSWRCAASPAKNYPEDFEERRAHQANGMGGVPIVGDPDDVAAELPHIHAAGARGIAVSFVNYLDELPFFCAEVLPRLARMDLRHPSPPQ